jgi:predicted component of type VI protein secretion system
MPREIALPPRFDLVIAGDFGGPATNRMTDISGEDIADILSSHGAVLRLEVANHLGNEPPALAVALPVATLRELDPATIVARVPEIVRAREIANAALTGSFAALDAEAKGPRFDKLTATLAQHMPAVRQAVTSASPADDGSIDALLAMVDLPTAPTSAEPARDALSAFLSTTARRQDAAAPSRSDPGPIARQIDEIASHPSLRAFEASWRGLRLILSARGRGNRAMIRLWDTGGEDMVASLASEAFVAAMAADGDVAHWGVLLVIGGFGGTPRELQALRDLASVGDARQVPVVVSLKSDFLGATPDAIARMDNPGALLESPAYAAWRGLRGSHESEFLFANWNDVVLRTDEAGAAPLWGDSGLIVAAQILSSLTRTGWPTEILGGDTPVEGLDVVEVAARAGRTIAIPLRAPIDPAMARDLARDGLICPVARADDDKAWLVRAAAVHHYGSVPDDARLAMESFAGLSFRFVSCLLGTLCRQVVAMLPRDMPEAEAAAVIAQAIEDMLQTSGAGAAVTVTPAAPEDEAARAFEVSVTLGQTVMGGFSFSFDLQG